MRSNERQSRWANDAGFTLVELLLGLTLMGLIGIAGYGSLSSGLRAQARAAERSNADELVRALFDLIGADIESAFFSGGALDTGFRGTHEGDGDQARDRLELVTTRGVLDPNRDIEFDRTGEQPLPGMDLVGVTYEIGEDGEMGLTRRVRRVLTAAESADDIVHDLASEVLAMKLEYYDGEQWQDVWDSTASKALPLAVSVTLTIALDPDADTEAEPVVITRVFRTFVKAPPDDEGQSGGAPGGGLPGGTP
jgi:type II secretion system protein J